MVAKASVVLFADAPVEPRQLVIRFLDGIDTGLRRELLQLVHKRKQAEKFEPITVVWEEPGGRLAERWSVTGHPDPIVLNRSAPLDQIDFRLVKPKPQPP